MRDPNDPPNEAGAGAAVVLVAGLPGSGKSYFAERLAARLGGRWLASDVVRADLGLRGRYERDDIDRVYEELLRRGTEAARAGVPPVLDATFSSRRYRARARAAAAAAGLPLRLIRVVADEPTTLRRVARAREHSEAGPEVYRLLERHFDPVEGPHLTLDSSAEDVEAMLAEAVAWLAAPAG